MDRNLINKKRGYAMKNVTIVSFILLMGFCDNYIFSQSTDSKTLQEGENFIQTHVYSVEENTNLLKLYQGLRVADVSDGMDVVGLPNTGLVNPVIQPLWIDTDSMTHVIRGIALTVRYVPTQKSDRPAIDEKFQDWESRFYNEFSSEAFTKIIQPGTVIVIDDVEDKDIGSIGSNNILYWYQNGAVGVVTDAGARDTDEVAKERVPLYLHKKGRGIRPGRNELESVNRPVCIGGVLVCPGDVVVADGDGVIVVPRAVAEKVATFAQQILTKDKTGRRQLYENLGRPLDQTVK
jgi:4-hydroxy-4-methyl-2-oxoglutarate aldolase